jgi:hypothetical protein
MSDFVSSLFRYTPYLQSTRKKKQLERIRRSKNKKTVRIYSPNNTVLEYDLDNDEKQMKRGSPKKRGVECGNGNEVFPCVYKGTEFETQQEWSKYVLSNHTKNISTGYRTINDHDRLTVAALKTNGKLARKIPIKYRIYDEVTGEIYDKRLMKK